MKYTLVIADKRDQVVVEYHGVELISEDRFMKDKFIKRMRFECDPEYSADPEHPDIVEFSVFPDGAVNVYKYIWEEDDELFGDRYATEGFATYKLIRIDKEDA